MQQHTELFKPRGKPDSVYDVVIAGAGPVGLFLACELALANVSVIVLEKADNLQSPLKQLPLGIRGITVPSMEAFDRRGLFEEVLKAIPVRVAIASQQGATGDQRRRLGGHFAGIQFDMSHVDFTKWSAYRLPDQTAAMLPLELENIEKVLNDRAMALGVKICRGCILENIEQHSEESGYVTISTSQKKNAIRACWLVGCDGGRSTVRKIGGFDFVGTDAVLTGYTALADFVNDDEFKKLAPGRNYTTGGYYQLQPDGSVIMAEFDGGKFHSKDGSTSLEHLQSVLRRVSSVNVTISAVHIASTWVDRARQATAYRKGRILLAGDAAHTHSPMGGQGLNLGLGDAMNLGWKLAATVHGWHCVGYDRDSLLETYFSERYPVGERILDWSRAQIALIKPSQESRSLHGIIRDIMSTKDGATYFAERVWGVSLRYDQVGTYYTGPGSHDYHDLVGRSVPNFEMVDGDTKLSVLLRGGTGLLLDFDGVETLRAVISRCDVKEGRIRYIAGRAKEQLGLRAVLVRPDGIVAWVSCGEAEAEVGELEKAVLFWFGTRV